IVLRTTTTESTTLTLDWELAARVGSNGLAFVLGLPKLDPTALSLDLPADLIPEGPSGVRQGPRSANQPGRMTWRFDGRGGAGVLLLLDRRKGRHAAIAPAFWAGGSTRVDVADGPAR